MAIEIERKFLLASMEWREAVTASIPMQQGYLGGSLSTIRVRQTPDQAFLTIKGRASGLARSEFEYPIPPEDASEMLAAMAVGFIVKKIRHIVPAGNGLNWEIDEYLDENFPLFTAEIELPSPETEFPIPGWLGREISNDKNYTNRSLSKSPYSKWQNGCPVAETDI